MSCKKKTEKSVPLLPRPVAKPLTNQAGKPAASSAKTGRNLYVEGPKRKRGRTIYKKPCPNGCIGEVADGKYIKSRCQQCGGSGISRSVGRIFSKGALVRKRHPASESNT